MTKRIILIAGLLAAGKTTFALRLSRELSVPCFCKDLFKTALSNSLPVGNQTESKRLSAATFDGMVFAAERCMEAGQPLILEANFHQRGEGDRLRALVSRCGYQALTFVLVGDLRVLYDRFVARELTPERGRANRLWEPVTWEAFEQSAELADFNIDGERIILDTTDFTAVDFAGYTERARRFADISMTE